jgi:dTDP-4-dehydrorhamnose 3,5-epimerase
VGAELSDENHHLLYVPPGFAHGFCVLSEIVDVIYQVTAEYAPDHETGILWDDPDVGVDWPITATKLSDRDQRLPRLSEAPKDFVFALH